MPLSEFQARLWDGYHINLRKVLKFNGAPDLYTGDLNDDLFVVYKSSRFDDQDSVTYLSFKHGFLTQILYNSAEVNDHSEFSEWSFAEADIPSYQ